MYIIETQHRRVPWRWVVALQVIKMAWLIGFYASGTMTFTMRKFISSPLIINSLSSLDVLFNIVVAAPCLYVSDRIWTRWGRRRPFVLIAWLVMMVCMLLLPLVGHAVPMAALIVLWLIFWDVNSVFDMLFFEIIPPEQRARASAIGAWLFNIVVMLQTIVLTGRFDDVVHVYGFALRGEQLIYWFVAGCLLVCFLYVTLFVRERKPLTPPPPSHGKGFIGAVGNLFAERTLWPVYFLAFSTILTQTGLGAIDPLLMTEQWGYSKQDMGTNVFVGGIINMFVVIPLVGWIGERLKLLKMFTIGVIGVLAVQIAYYLFVRFGLPDQRPSIGQIIFFGQCMSMMGAFSLIAWQPLIFEYIPRSQMGTAQAGLNFVRSITRLLTLNGIGLWVTWYSRLFRPPGQYDYFSGYLFMILMNAFGCGLLLWFARSVRQGTIKPLGVTEFKPVEEQNQENATRGSDA
ncbi:MAG: MFS transporter [bacterium]|nr:MFS transporter [bacterium]